MTNSILSKGKILVVDDELIMRESLHSWLEEDGMEVHTAESGEEGLEMAKKENFDVMLVDLKMPGMDGIQFLKEVKKIQPQASIIIMTAYASVDTAVEAMKQGAYDYVIKPFNPDEITMTIRKILDHQSLVRENIYLRLSLKKQYDFHNIISKNHKMQKIFRLIETIADSKSSVLILGESGTGKELIAKAIHYNSSRHDKPFISVSCATIQESLIESELFGHEKGAFTDALSTRKGKFELADGGTLFLDEVADLSPKVQTSLLRVLQEKEFMRVGGEKYIKVDVRVISATNRDLWKAVQEGKFREDLYYRLNVITIHIPPLRERTEDIPLLVEHFISKYNVENSRKVEGINEEALQILMNYHWPGNVRELENVIERAVLINKTGIIAPEDLPPYLVPGAEPSYDRADLASLEEVEKQHILNVLKKNNWNIRRSAQILKIDRTTLYAKIRRYGLRQNQRSR